MRGLLGDALLGLYLHGSAVALGLRPDSDLDLLVLTGRALTDDERAAILASLLRISARHPGVPEGHRCLDVMVIQRSGAAEVPPRADFTYGEWLRTGFEAGVSPMPSRSPDHALVLAQVRQAAVPLLGPPAPELLPEIPPEQVHAALRQALPALLAELQGDERNVLLTLARMWRTALTGDFVPKDAAAAWAMPRLGGADAATLDLARRGYRGETADDWTARGDAARQLAATLQVHLLAAL